MLQNNENKLAWMSQCQLEKLTEYTPLLSPLAKISQLASQLLKYLLTLTKHLTLVIFTGLPALLPYILYSTDESVFP